MKKDSVPPETVAVPETAPVAPAPSIFRRAAGILAERAKSAHDAMVARLTPHLDAAAATLAGVLVSALPLGAAYGCYQVLGSLRLSFPPDATNTPATNYRRELDLDEAVARMQFSRGGVEFRREMFVSAADDAVLLVTAGTDYQGFAGRQAKNPLAFSLKELDKGY